MRLLALGKCLKEESQQTQGRNVCPNQSGITVCSLLKTEYVCSNIRLKRCYICKEHVNVNGSFITLKNSLIVTVYNVISFHLLHLRTTLFFKYLKTFQGEDILVRNCSGCSNCQNIFEMPRDEFYNIQGKWEQDKKVASQTSIGMVLIQIHLK